MQDKIVAIEFDDTSKNVIVIPEHWDNGQSGFQNADVYLIVDAETEKSVATVCFSEDKSDWEFSSQLPADAEEQLITYIKSQTPLYNISIDSKYYLNNNIILNFKQLLIIAIII